MSTGGALLTGSRVYGSPREDSDLDLVILVTEHEFRLLEEHGQKAIRGSADDQPRSTSLRFGPLNVIATTDLLMFEAWKTGTEGLKERRAHNLPPPTRDEAVERFKTLFAWVKECNK